MFAFNNKTANAMTTAMNSSAADTCCANMNIAIIMGAIIVASIFVLINISLISIISLLALIIALVIILAPISLNRLKDPALILYS